MRNLIPILLVVVLLVGCDVVEPQNQTLYNSYTPCTNFILKNDFYEVDDNTFLLMMDNSLDVFSLTEKEKSKLLDSYKNGFTFSRAFNKKGSINTENNVIIHLDGSKPTKKVLDNLMIEIQATHKFLPQDWGFKLIDSGISEWREENREFDYLYLISEHSYGGRHWYSSQIQFDIYGRYYTVIINSQDNLNIEDVITSVYSPF